MKLNLPFAAKLKIKLLEGNKVKRIVLKKGDNPIVVALFFPDCGMPQAVTSKLILNFFHSYQLRFLSF